MCSLSVVSFLSSLSLFCSIPLALSFGPPHSTGPLSLYQAIPKLSLSLPDGLRPSMEWNACIPSSRTAEPASPRARPRPRAFCIFGFWRSRWARVFATHRHRILPWANVEPLTVEPWRQGCRVSRCPASTSTYVVPAWSPCGTSDRQGSMPDNNPQYPSPAEAQRPEWALRCPMSGFCARARSGEYGVVSLCWAVTCFKDKVSPHSTQDNHGCGRGGLNCTVHDHHSRSRATATATTASAGHNKQPGLGLGTPSWRRYPAPSGRCRTHARTAN